MSFIYYSLDTCWWMVKMLGIRWYNHEVNGCSLHWNSGLPEILKGFGLNVTLWVCTESYQEKLLFSIATRYNTYYIWRLNFLAIPKDLMNNVYYIPPPIIQKLYIFPTEYTSGFRVILRINSDYFSNTVTWLLFLMEMQHALGKCWSLDII
jgi:hypothetical protein